MTARDLARQSFWTERALVRLFQSATNKASFSLREFIAFAEALPASTIEALAREEAHERQQLLPAVVDHAPLPALAR